MVKSQLVQRLMMGASMSKLLPLVSYLLQVISHTDGLAISVNSKNDNVFKKYPPPCDSKIFCFGKLLHTIQMAHLEKDSKHFVDQKLLHDPTTVEENFENFMERVSNKPTKLQTKEFLMKNFGPTGTEFVPWIPPDWVPEPKFLKRIKNKNLRKFGADLNRLWEILGRKDSPDVRDNQERYSLIHVPHEVMVPGGRFTEFYYWDQFWILKGLILSEMYTTVRGMIENFLYMVEHFGFVPNGGRIYYARSQPPLLIPMVNDYMKATNNITFLEKNIETLDKEFEFWMKNRTVLVHKDGVKYRLARYNNELDGPRPEAYREDYELAQNLTTEEEKTELYMNLKSGAESGWDFSSRWFIPANDSTTGHLKDIKCRYLIPVELNVFIYNNAKLMSRFHSLLQNPIKAAYYKARAAEWKLGINKVLWWEKEQAGAWFDYDILHNRLREDFYPTNIYPLWAQIDADGSLDSTTNKVLKYLKKSGALAYPGGLPTSLENSGEQWDFPNGWAPLQHLAVESLENTQNANAKELAFDLAQRWVSNNYLAFKKTGAMFEKYDVQTVGEAGGGGEYEVVVGFGWTNGVILDFLNRYGDRLVTPETNS